MELSQLGPWVEARKGEIEDALRTLVEINTYTANEPGVDAGMRVLDGLAARLGLTCEPLNGRHRLVKSGDGTTRPRILLLSHMDTVFPPDGDFLHYEPLGDGFVRGPGTGDIKGGLLIGLYAMAALGELLPHFDVQMVVCANEETGSPTLRDWYLGGHVGADYAIGLEPGFPQGPLTPDVALGVVYQRRGYCAIQFRVTGKSTHSGTPWLGVNAIEALAQRVIRIHALDDPARGLNATVGLVRGGISANTVAGEAEALASLRFERTADGEWARDQVAAIVRASYVENAALGLCDSAEMQIDAFLPPMERSDGGQVMVDIVLEEAQRLGQNVVAIARGGGSDANFTSAAGTPSICGMGAPTDGIHTTSETIYLPGLFGRVELLASTLYRLTQRGL